MNNKKFGGCRPPTGTPSLGLSIVVVVVSLLGGASIVHNIYKPDLRKWRSPTEILSSSLASLVLFCMSQLSLALVPQLFPWLSLVAMLPVSALVLMATIGLGRFSKRILGVKQSAPAMVVFHLLFFWGVYIAEIREAVPSLLDAIINAECALLLFGLYRILSADPGIVAYESSSAMHECNGDPEANFHYESSPPFSRVRYCRICKTSVRGFDHHCAAFGNCIGQKNHRLFMMLLVGFIIAEASYTMSSTQYIVKSLRTHKVGFENDLPGNLVISTLLFTVLQLLWQVMFLMWNIYCICANIKTDEWILLLLVIFGPDPNAVSADRINWKQYPEFRLVIQSPPGNSSEPKFSNPYNKGILGNIRDFLNPIE